MKKSKIFQWEKYKIGHIILINLNQIPYNMKMRERSLSTIEYFLQLFGAIPLSTVIVFIAAVAFLVGLNIKVYKFIVTNHDKLQEKDETLKKIADCLEEVKQEQKGLKEAINELRGAQQEIAEKQDIFEEQHRNHSLNRLRDRLLGSYRYYTDPKKNPLQAWSEMEKEAFDKLFHDYEELGGDGFMHSTVEPAMAALEVVLMTDTARLAEVMKQRLG